MGCGTSKDSQVRQMNISINFFFKSIKIWCGYHMFWEIGLGVSAVKWKGWKRNELSQKNNISLLWFNQLIIWIWQYFYFQMWWQNISVLHIFCNEMPLDLYKVIYIMFMLYCLLIISKIYLMMCLVLYKGNNKITELRTILQRESQKLISI